MIKDILRDIVSRMADIAGTVVGWLAGFFEDIPNAWDYDSAHKWYSEVESRNLRSLKGDTVASFEELMIANWLYLNGIAYEYEPTYEHKLAGTGRRAYTPDFRLTESGVYLEHFGVRKTTRKDGSEELTTAPFIDRDAYLESMAWILEVMRAGMRMDRGAVSLLDRRRGRVFIHDSFGLTEEEERRGVYALGEGITGKVVESGKVIIAPRLHENPDFLDRTGAHAGETRRKSAFVCVPIMLGRKVLGAIAGERCYVSRRLLKQDAEFLAAIALMIAPAVELYLIANVERLELERQNRALKDALKERFRPTNIIGNSKAMMADVYALIGKVSKTRATVLILGESGVGKELIASAIHYSSDRVDGSSA